MLGELLASQLHHYILNKIPSLKSDRDISYIGQREVGDFLRKKVFEPGAVYRWNDMIELATGEPLTPKYWAEQYVN